MSTNQSRNLSRRIVLAGGLAAGAGLALGARFTPATAQSAPPAAAPSSLPLITKPIPSTGERLPVVGIGTNQYGVTGAADLAARREVLEHLPKLGGKLVDTAYRYGDSELVIGKLVKELGNRNDLFIATKTAPPNEVPTRQALEQNFKRLQMQKLDLVQIHSFRGTDELLPLLAEAKAAGKIRYVGVTTSSDSQYPEMIEALNKRRLDFIQVDYSIENQGAEKILQLARDKGVAVLINVPLGGRGAGLLSKASGKPLPEWARSELDVTSWAQLLLKYTIAHPAVTVVIPGTTKLTHLQDNQLAGRGRLPDEAQRKKIEQYWATI
jgi:aryl-alcohol dehydrogenase-like predicted oxidoreductase